MAIKRYKKRRRNPGLEWFKTRNGAIVLGAATAGVAGAIVYSIYRIGRKPPLQSPESGVIVTDDHGNMIVSPQTVIPTKSVPAAKLPDVILQGGVPIEPPWQEIGWYTYPADQFWIRIDQYGDPVFQERSNSLTSHRAQLIGRWRWTVIGGEATPIATGEMPQGSYDLEHSVIRSTYDKQSAIDEMAMATANQAAEWINTAYQLGE